MWNCSVVCTACTCKYSALRNSLSLSLLPSSPDVLHRIAAYLHLLPSLPDDQHTSYSSSFLLEILVSRHERRPSQLEALNSMPLYPTETVLWDKSVVPSEYFDGEGTICY